MLASIFMGQVISTASAQPNDSVKLGKQLESLTKLVEELQSTVSRQNSEISELKKKVSISAPIAPTSGSKIVDSGKAPSYSGTKTFGNYTPEIGVVADIVASSSQSKEDEEGNDRLSARELEIVLGHDVDPYSRLDATVALSDFEEASLEEAYISYWDLPLESKLRAGRFHPKIGKAASIHRDSLDTVDEPLVIQKYFGVEGATKSGADLGFFTPLSGDNFTQQLTLGVLEGGNGEDGALFSESRRAPQLYGRLSNALDISDSTNAELGLTYINGSSDEDSSGEVNVIGADLSLVHKFDGVRKVKFVSEVYSRHGDKNYEAPEGEELFISSKKNPIGYYSLLDLRMSERWGIGTRWDWVQPIISDVEYKDSAEHALTGYLTFFQSEFARWRLQYQKPYFVDGETDNRVFLQGTFAIGTHKHSIQ